MKAIIALCLIAAAAVAYARPDEKYTDKFDHVNLDEILENERVLKSNADCLLKRGKCSPDAKELREHITEALETKCAKCTEAQKEGTRKVISHLINKKPELWKELSDEYDHDGKFTKEYEKELKEVKA